MADPSPVRVWLVHHGHALAPGEDPMRPLSAQGRAAVEQLARAAAGRGVQPRAIWHSGKLRARQTAEAFWRLCQPLAELTAVRGLQPDDPPEWMADQLRLEDGDVLLVGHMPHLPRLLQLMIGGDAGSGGADFPPNGMVCLERHDGGWLERWRLRT